MQICGQGEPAGRHCGHEPLEDVDELEDAPVTITLPLLIPELFLCTNTTEIPLIKLELKSDS